MIAKLLLQGLYWALACIWLRYPGIRIPHIKGESYFSNETAYEPLYSDYIPIEFAVNGIVSACLTVINVICIFITAIVILKVLLISLLIFPSLQLTFACC